MELAGQVAIVTGAGQGLGRAYALDLAKNGCAVLVNDPGKKDGKPTADMVVQEIKQLGGKAVASYDPIGSDFSIAEKIINQAIKELGGLTILVNNAGVLRDRSFAKQSDEEWNLVYSVHLHGTRNMCKAAWPHFTQAKYGRIVNISSINGVRGAPGQSNYSACKAAIIAFSKVLAIEGDRYNIRCNAVLPGAGTAMTATVMPSNVVNAADPKYVAPMVTYLCTKEVPTGRVFEAGIGFFAELQWRRSQGIMLNIDESYDFRTIAKNFDKISDMSNAVDPVVEDGSGIPKQLSQVLSKL